MRTTTWIALGVVGLSAACEGTSRSDFIERYEELFCEAYTVCATDAMLVTIGERECYEYLRYGEYPDDAACKYQADAAEQCLAELSGSGCVDDNPEIPLICGDVFSQCPLPRLPPKDGVDVPVGG